VGTKILIADDDPIVRQMYGHHLLRAGYELISAADGRSALEAVERQKPHLAVLDISMPELDGISVIVEIKKTAAMRSIPVILISAEPQYYSCRREFAQAGAALFLGKPFGPGQLLEAIRKVLTAPASPRPGAA
jgi:CheY-like chemotaxis protein